MGMPIRFRTLRFLFLPMFLLLGGCAPHAALSPVSASTLAARLANEECGKNFGSRPFAPEDFEAMLDGGRWHWGTIDGAKVDGYLVEISFDRTGGGKSVVVKVPEE